MRGRDIVCVGFSDWDNPLKTNEQHLLRRMAPDNRILFVESLGLRRPQVASSDLRRIGRRLKRGLAPPREIDGLHVLAPLVLPLHGNPVARALNARILPGLVRHAVRRLGLRDVLLWTFVPQAEVLLGPLKPDKVLYYIDDDHAAKIGIDAESFSAAETRFAPRADAVLASAPALYERMRTLNSNTEFAPNVTDTALFATALEPGPVDPAVDALPRPRIVFTGAIVADKIDLELVVGVTKARPEWSFAFVGPVGPGDPNTNVDALRHLPNLVLPGPRPYAALPTVLRGADAAIVPYRVDGAMPSVFPMKIYEYMAAGAPVISTRLPALDGVEGIAFASTVDETVAAIEAALAADSPQRRAERSQAALPYSWEARIDQIERVVYGATSRASA